MEAPAPHHTGPVFNVNSILTAITLAAIMWVGNKAASNNDALTEIRTQLPFINQSMAKLEAQITQLVTRQEMESRLAEFTSRNALMDKRLLMLEFDTKKNQKP